MKRIYINTVHFFILPLFILCFSQLAFTQNENDNIQQPNNKEDSTSSRTDYAISGKALIAPNSTGYAGLAITFSGGVGDAIVDRYGNYSKNVPAGWTGTATPVNCNETYQQFDPPQMQYTNVTAAITNQNYAVTVTTMFTISGTITQKYTGEPLADTEIKFVKSFGVPPTTITTTTNALGEYSFEVLPCFSNSLDLKITNLDYTEPFFTSYTEVLSDIPDQDYTYINLEYPVPAEWEYVSTGSVAWCAIETTSNPNICDIPLELGDLIGVFYTGGDGELHCGGYGIWQDEYNVAVTAFGDDNTTTEKDGFGFNETYTWKVYSYAEQNTFGAQVTLRSGKAYWSPFGGSVIKAVDAEYPNNIVIPQGWSGLSSYTPPVSAVITNVMSPIINELVVIQNMTSMYYPGIGVNTMYVWSPTKGYKIKVTEDVELPMPGCTNSTKTVSLVKTWNMIPVISSCNVMLTDVFNPIMNKVTVIKEIAGTKIYWPAMGITTLQILQPGKAYYVAVTQNTSITYPLCSALKSNIVDDESPSEINLTPWNTPVKTGFTHTFGVESGAIKDLSNGDYIGAFTEDGTCAGLAQINDISQNLPVTIFGEDISTDETDGFWEGETINFKIFKTLTGEEINAIVEYDGNMPSSDGKFTDNGLSVIKSLDYASAGISTINRNVNFYPNPTTGLVEFFTTNDDLYNFAIQNINGQVILQQTLKGTGRYDLSLFNKGVYIVKIEGPNYRSIEKLILK